MKVNERILQETEFRACDNLWVVAWYVRTLSTEQKRATAPFLFAKLQTANNAIFYILHSIDTFTLSQQPIPDMESRILWTVDFRKEFEGISL